ncbi:unnamed protein product [Cladocopium goreaui]|uniref:Uncharacterized protein n=1 Tax=Cladocopium goreaui TaxID=2562237 RepID=A0A9P1M520_9DINO|nr:unnamed protein product [Cladocopium goreaui]
MIQVVDRLRIAAKDVQNYIDRSLLLTHGFVPIIESTYPCHGGNKAVSLAHSLHLGLGRVKEAVGGGGAVGAGHAVPTAGAADLLADTERALGSVIGQAPDGLQPMLEEKDSQEEENVVMAAIPAIPEPMIYPLSASCRRWRCQRQGDVLRKLRSQFHKVSE